MRPHSTRHARRLALIGIFGPLFFWGTVGLLGVLTPDYSQVSNFISTLGAVGAPYALVQGVNFVVLGFAIGAFGVAMHAWFGDAWRPVPSTVLFWLFGLGVVGAGIFPTDPADPASTTSMLHDAASAVGSLSGILAISLVSRRLDADERWPRHRFATGGTVAGLLITAGLFASSIDTAWVGLGQRMFIGMLTLWIVAVSIQLYRLADENSIKG